MARGINKIQTNNIQLTLSANTSIQTVFSPVLELLLGWGKNGAVNTEGLVGVHDYAESQLTEI